MVGRTLNENLRAVGVHTQFVLATPQYATGVAVIEAEDGGQNPFVTSPRANVHVPESDVAAARVATTSAQALVVQLEVPRATVVASLRLAREAKVLIVLNPAPAQLLPPEVLALADV